MRRSSASCDVRSLSVKSRDASRRKQVASPKVPTPATLGDRESVLLGRQEEKWADDSMSSAQELER